MITSMFFFTPVCYIYFSGVNFRGEHFCENFFADCEEKMQKVQKLYATQFFAPWYLHLVLTTILKRYTVAGRLYVEAANPRKLLLQLWNDQKTTGLKNDKVDLEDMIN